MRLVNNLVFKGNCREAFERYAEVLGGEIKAMFPFGEAPDGMPIDEQCRDMIMHAWLEVGDQAMMGCDAPPAYQQDMGGFSVAFHTDDPAHRRSASSRRWRTAARCRCRSPRRSGRRPSLC